MNKSVLDAGIPLLTEIISPNQENRAVVPPSIAPAPMQKPEQQTSPEQTSPEIPGTEAMHGWTEDDWSEFKHQISEHVLQQMLGRIDSVLEQRVRDSLADVLQIAVDGLSKEIRQGLQQAMQDVLKHAVSQEIDRLKTNKR